MNSDSYQIVQSEGTIDIDLANLTNDPVNPEDKDTVQFTVVAYDGIGNVSTPGPNDKGSVIWDEAVVAVTENDFDLTIDDNTLVASQDVEIGESVVLEYSSIPTTSVPGTYNVTNNATGPEITSSTVIASNLDIDEDSHISVRYVDVYGNKSDWRKIVSGLPEA